jgi:hypothetical protein
VLPIEVSGVVGHVVEEPPELIGHASTQCGTSGRMELFPLVQP